MTFNYPVNMVILDSITANNSATVTFTNLTSSYNWIYVMFHSVYPITNGAILQAQLSNNNGVSWLTGYAGAIQIVQSNSATLGSADFSGTTQFNIASNLQNNGANRCQGIITLANGPVGGINNRVYWESTLDVTGIVVNYSATADIAANFNAIRFFMSAGNIAAGTFNIYRLVGPGAI